MKKYLWGVLLTCFVMILVIIYKTNKNEEPLQASLGISVNTLSGEIYNTNVIDSKPTLVFFLHPNCPDCEIEAKFISDNNQSLIKNFNVITICASKFQDAYPFFESHNLINKNQNIILGYDPDKRIIIKYNIVTTPTCLLFDSEGNQKNRIESLVTSLTEIESNFIND
jgi:thiol-disulfide isomerase/thioredoxin